MCNKYLKYHEFFVVKIEGGVSNKAIARSFAEGVSDDISLVFFLKRFSKTSLVFFLLTL